jgi:putative ABC transport system permease protein
MSQLWQDMLYAFRTLRSAPGFAAVAILTLAVGIGANAAIFSFVNGILLNPLPYPTADRIVRVLEKPPGSPTARNGISTLNYLDWEQQNKVFEYMAPQTGGGAVLTGSGDPVQLRGARVGVHYFDIFGIKAAQGRLFLPDENQLGKENVVVLSSVLWRDQFGLDPNIVGRKIVLDGQPYTIVGVLPPGSAFDRAGPQFWRPLVFEPSNMTRNFHWFVSFGLLKEGVTFEQAQQDMDAIGARIATDFPDSNKGWGVGLDLYKNIFINDSLRTSIMTLMYAVGGMLLIGCANIANLSLARGVTREREVSVRASVGAGRWRLIRQFLTENVVLSLIGGMLGIGVGYGTMIWLKSLVPPNMLPQEAVVALDTRVLLFTFGVSVLVGILFGLAPALQASKPDLAAAMKEGGRGSTAGGGRKIIRDALVVAEIAIAFVLLAGSGLLIRSFFRLINVDTGMNTTSVLTFGLPASDKQYPDPAALNAYYTQLSEAVKSVPGVRDVALSCAPPMSGTCYGMPFQLASKPAVDRANRQGRPYKIVSHSYFNTLGIRLLKGRFLNEHDRKGAVNAMVINNRFANTFFKDVEPVGQRILIQEIIPGKTQLGPEIAWEVVGVIDNEKLGGLMDDRSEVMYVSNEQTPVYGMTMSVRTNLDPASLEKSIRQAISAVNRNQPMNNVRTLQRIMDDSASSNRMQTMLLTIFSGIALLLASIGIYGVLAYAVTQRTHELGLRAALGASRSTLLSLVLLRGLILAVIGLLIGLGAALGLTKYIGTILYNVPPRDPATLAWVAAVLAGVALLACYIPARRATKVDPMVALRYE